jgi:butyryl-CoA dehydrogenase
VEQYWRDNRLNMIHESTHGIQGLDLLGRKVVMDQGRSLAVLAARIEKTIHAALARPELAEQAKQLGAALAQVGRATQGAWSTGQPEEALANATPYLQAFGHTVLAWLWLDLALAVDGRDDAFAQGKRAALRYFYAYELPKIAAWLAVVERREPLCREVQDAWL